MSVLPPLMDGLPFPLVITRLADGVVLAVNRAGAEVFGLTPQQTVGRRSTEFYVEASERTRLVGLLERDGAVSNFEAQLQAPDGRRFWALLAGSRTELEGEPVVVVAFSVIDRQKQLEGELAKRSSALHDLLQAVPFPLVVTTLDGFVVEINQRASELFGVPRDQAVGLRAPDFWANPDDRVQMAQTLGRDGKVEELEVELKDKAGRRFWTLFSARILSGATKTLVAGFNVIDERRRMEHELRAAKEQAEANLAQLREAQASLIQAEKMASLGQLTAGIAHEIKNPLNFVNNFAGLSIEMLDELKAAIAPALTALDETARKESEETIRLLTANLTKVSEHGGRADGIVKSMLAHSRGGPGEWQATDINGLLEEALNLAYHGARAQDPDFNVELERDFDRAGRTIEAVPQDLMRVFLNLVGNGFYAVAKQRRLTAEPGFRPRLRVATRDLGDRIEVRVRDNGTGITPEVRGRLFQPFFTTKPAGEGTGLGLSISYDIVAQRHGGLIEVESEPGRFTEFTVRLPRRSRIDPARSGR